jgi:NUMOD3 motif
MSDEQKRKISQSNIGKNKGRKSPLLGRHLSEDQKRKISDSWQKRFGQEASISQGRLIRPVITGKQGGNTIRLPNYWVGKLVKCDPVEVDGVLEEAYPTYVRPLGRSGGHISLPRSWLGKTVTCTIIEKEPETIDGNDRVDVVVYGSELQ